MLENYKDVLNINDICEILGIGRNKAYDLIKTEQIKSLSIGKNIRVPKGYLLEFMYPNGIECYNRFNVNEMTACQ